MPRPESRISNSAQPFRALSENSIRPDLSPIASVIAALSEITPRGGFMARLNARIRAVTSSIFRAAHITSERF